MAVTIHIPTPLRPYVGGKDEVNVEKTGTVADILSSLTEGNSELKKHLYDESGKLRKFVNIYVNDEDIRYGNGNNTAVKSGDTISIVPSIAGG